MVRTTHAALYYTVPIFYRIICIQTALKIQGAGPTDPQRGQANWRCDPELNRDEKIKDVATTPNTTTHWTNDGSTSTNSKTFDSCFRCYIRFAIYPSRTRHVYTRYSLKEIQKETDGYFTRGNYERKHHKIPGGQTMVHFEKEPMPNDACPASCPSVGTLRK